MPPASPAHSNCQKRPWDVKCDRSAFKIPSISPPGQGKREKKEQDNDKKETPYEDQEGERKGINKNET